jgi:hypothetical protein
MQNPINNNENIDSNHPAWRGINTGKFFLGLLILIIGICYLGESFGLNTINVGYIFQHFWSILLIFFGLSMLSRTSRTMTILGLIITTVVLIGLFYIATNDATFSELKRLENIEVMTLPGITKARIRIDSQAAALKIVGDPDLTVPSSSVAISKLLTGTFQSAEMNLKTTSSVTGQTQNILLNTRDQNSQFGWQYFGKNIGNFSLKLTEKFPVELEINSTAADINLDLTDVLASLVVIKSSASNILISLGNLEPKLAIDIQSKASVVTLRVPTDVGVDLRFSANISSKTLPDFILVSDGRYESRNFKQAEKRAFITLDSPVTSFDIIWK